MPKFDSIPIARVPIYEGRKQFIRQEISIVFVV